MLARGAESHAALHASEGAGEPPGGTLAPRGALGMRRAERLTELSFCAASALGRCVGVAALRPSLRRGHRAVIDQEEITYCLAALGALDGLTDETVDAVIAQQFAKSDKDGSGGLCFDEFASFYNSAKRRQHTLDTTELKDVFFCLCSFKTFKRRDGLNINEGDWLKGMMNKAIFTKMVADVGFELNAKEAGKVYKEAVPYGEMKLGYEQWLDALSLLAEAIGKSMQSVAHRILELGGYDQATIEKAVPGPKTPYAGKYLAESAALARATEDDGVPEDVIVGMRDLFERFSRFGSKSDKHMRAEEMRDFLFIKLCRDCSLLDSRVTEKGLKKIFSDCTPKNSATMSFMHFFKAIGKIAGLKDDQSAADLMTYLAKLKMIDVENQEPEEETAPPA